MRYFNPAEFMCKCCGANKMDPYFLTQLDELRARCGFPLAVTSGYRCSKQNQKVSTTGPNGPHTTGQAADLGVNRAQALEVLRHALDIGFTGVGVQQKGDARFIHLDSLPNAPGQPRPTIWSY